MRTRTKRSLLLAPLALAAALGLFVGIGVPASYPPTAPAALGPSVPFSGVPFSRMEALIDRPGPLSTKTFVSADWQVDREGLIDLAHPEAKKADLKGGLEPIQIYLHVVRHPQRGTFFIDTGVERAVRDAPERAVLRGVMAKAMHIDLMKVIHDTASVVAAEGAPAGVFFTHLHTDHIAGLPDIPKGTPLYTGPGETSQRFFLNAFAKGPTDEALAGHAPISELPFARDPDGRFEGILDVFGDGSFFALWVPGHTAGSAAYLARTEAGPVLYVGDTCHTQWGWEHGVPPGQFTRDGKQNAESLTRLRALVAAHPKMEVRLGHQPAGPASPRADGSTPSASQARPTAAAP